MDFHIENARVIAESPSGKVLLINAPVLGECTWIPKKMITEDSEIWKVGVCPVNLSSRDGLLRGKVGF